MPLTRSPAFLRIPFVILLFFGARSLLADTTQANALLQQGRVDEASANLQQLLTAQPDDAFAHQLLCRVYYAQEIADNAIHECELAARYAPSSSDNQMWLARAYGFKASHANPISALNLAIKVRVAFEHAVQLDPENINAMSDLGEFYVAAPSIIGGGLDKAQALAARMQPQFPAQSHRLLALIAEKRKDNTLAETEFLNAVAAGKTPEAYIDLGHFYQRHNQPDKMVETLKSGSNRRPPQRPRPRRCCQHSYRRPSLP